MSRRRRSRSRSPDRGRRKDSKDRTSSRRSRTKDSRSRRYESDARRYRRDRNRSRSGSSSDSSEERGGHRRRRHSPSSSPESPRPHRAREKQPQHSSKKESSLDLKSKQERHQERISTLLNKTDEHYKLIEAHHRPAPVPTSVQIATIEMDDFVPQTFTSHRSSSTAKSTEEEQGEKSHDSHMGTMFGSKLTPSPNPTPSSVKIDNDEVQQEDIMTDSDRLYMWLSRLQGLRTKYKPPNSARN